MTSISDAIADGIDATLSTPRATALTTAVALVASLVAAFVDPVAGAVCVVVLFAGLVALFTYALRQRAAFEGPYRVVSDKTSWDLHDPTGSIATVTRELEVIFNYPTIAFEDSTSGDGDHFGRYDCNVGHVVHNHRQADRQRVIVALHRRYDRDEPLTIVTHRDVTNGFLDSEEWIRLEIHNRSQRSELVVVFPQSRPPARVTITERRNDRETTRELELREQAKRVVGGIPPARYRQGTMFEVRWNW